MITLFADTDSDITPTLAKELNLKLISMPYIVDDQEIYPYETWEEFDEHGFYDMLRGGKIPTTCGLSPAKYISYFRPEFEKGNDILYVHFSAAMTMTFDAMDAALEELKKEFPDRKFYRIDTKAITAFSYAVVLQIAKLFNEGKPVDEIIKLSKDIVDHQAAYFYANDLKFFKKSGRVSGIKAFMGDLIGVKPIISIGDDGKMGQIGKASGRKNAVKFLLDKMVELGDHITDYPIIIGHSDVLNLAQEFGEEVKAKFGDKCDIHYVTVNPTAGSHCGPNAVGVSFHAIHR